jgi:hypothetical protein
MRRGVGRVVGLRFDDDSADAVDSESHADQVARGLGHVSPEEIGTERDVVDGRGSACGRHLLSL